MPRSSFSRLSLVVRKAVVAPLLAPGVSSLLHDQLSKNKVIGHSLEINSNSGICSSGAQAIVNAARAVKSGDAHAAICVGVEQSSIGLKSKAFRTVYDFPAMLRDVRSSQWFMSVFLRFMLSDGAGAFLLEGQPTGLLEIPVEWMRDDAMYYPRQNPQSPRPATSELSASSLQTLQGDGGAPGFVNEAERKASTTHVPRAVSLLSRTKV